MNLLHSFISIHLPTAKEEEYFSNSIVRYSGDKKIFVIGLGNNKGVITEQKKVEILRSAGAKIKNVNKNGQHLKISESLIWRIAVVSQENLGRKNMIETQAKADELKDYISLHFLSSGRHPNFKNRNLIDFHDDFEVFFKAIKNDFGNYVATIKN